MKLSEKTVSILKNFSEINTSLLIQKGTTQRTIHLDDVIAAVCEIPDDFPMTFGIYNLPEFLANYSTLNNPDLTFESNYLTMKSDNLSLKYYYCAPNLIKSANVKLAVDNPDVSFDLDHNIFQKLLKVGTLNGFTHLTIVGKDGKLSATMLVPSNDSSNSVTYEIGDYTDKDFVASFIVEHLKIVPTKYKVKILLAGLAQFTSEDGTITYFIPLDKKGSK